MGAGRPGFWLGRDNNDLTNKLINKLE